MRRTDYLGHEPHAAAGRDGRTRSIPPRSAREPVPRMRTTGCREQSIARRYPARVNAVGNGVHGGVRGVGRLRGDPAGPAHRRDGAPGDRLVELFHLVMRIAMVAMTSLDPPSTTPPPDRLPTHSSPRHVAVAADGGGVRPATAGHSAVLLPSPVAVAVLDWRQTVDRTDDTRRTLGDRVGPDVIDSRCAGPPPWRGLSRLPEDSSAAAPARYLRDLLNRPQALVRHVGARAEPRSELCGAVQHAFQHGEPTRVGDLVWMQCDDVGPLRVAAERLQLGGPRLLDCEGVMRMSVCQPKRSSHSSQLQGISAKRLPDIAGWR